MKFLSLILMSALLSTNLMAQTVAPGEPNPNGGPSTQPGPSTRPGPSVKPPIEGSAANGGPSTGGQIPVDRPIKRPSTNPNGANANSQALATDSDATIPVDKPVKGDKGDKKERNEKREDRKEKREDRKERRAGKK
jgi:hypothetical protein